MLIFKMCQKPKMYLLIKRAYRNSYFKVILTCELSVTIFFVIIITVINELFNVRNVRVPTCLLSDSVLSRVTSRIFTCGKIGTLQPETSILLREGRVSARLSGAEDDGCGIVWV